MQTLETLAHTTRPLRHGGKVVILETGSIIGPEANAMLQALHSRSIGGIASHLEILREKGAEKFMSTFYVGYGHKSIGDCGSATVFIEGVSMLAAKAIQDGKLYNGQEASTRYIDFAQQPFLDITHTQAGAALMERQRTFYLHALEAMKEALRERFPRNETEKESVYEKAIAARAFDTIRGFLPAGATTNLAWHGTLRQFADRLLLLRHHPLAEVRDIAHELESALLTAFPNSFSTKRYEETEAYASQLMQGAYYWHDASCPDFAASHSEVDTALLNTFRPLLEKRPAKTELPKFVGVCGDMRFAFTLDFGSFRDLQRHRAITQRMPLLTEEIGFHPWYLEELTPELRSEAHMLLSALRQDTDALSLSREDRQYYIPMGYLTSCQFSGDLPSVVYLAELRATRFVHPTLRARAQQMADALRTAFGEHGLTIHLDADPDRFDVRRGEHDISIKA